MMRTCEYAENARSTTNIQHDLILEMFRTVEDGIHVGLGAYCILEHILMDGEVRIAIEVVVGVLDITVLSRLVEAGCQVEALLGTRSVAS